MQDFEDEVDDGPEMIRHRFQNRTLKIFLKEMRLALTDQNLMEAFKVLDDLEYVAHNLESPKRTKQVWMLFVTKFSGPTSLTAHRSVNYFNFN